MPIKFQFGMVLIVFCLTGCAASVSPEDLQQCLDTKDVYYDMPLDQMKTLVDQGAPETEDEMFMYIYKNKKEVIERYKNDPIRFTLVKDDFSGDVKFRTQSRKDHGFRNWPCPYNWNWGTAGWTKDRSLIRGSVTKEGQSWLQAYFYFPVPSLEWHFDVYRIVSKNLGELDYSLIDVQHYTDNETYITTYTSNIAINLTLDQLKKLYELKSNEQFKFYSKTGQHKVLELPYPHVQTFYDGMKTNKIEEKFSQP